MNMGEIFGIPVLKLLQIFAVPLTLGALVPLLNWLQEKRELVVENQRAKGQVLLEQRRAQDQALQAYLDQMSQLLANNKALKPDDRVSAIVRARTLSLLETLHSPLLDPAMIRAVVLFLYEAGLISVKDGPIIRLTGANVEGASLTMRGLPSRPTQTDLGTVDASNRSAKEMLCAAPKPAPELDLSGVSLGRTRLNQALMTRVDLSDADLSEAALLDTYLSGSRLVNANLSDAILVNAHLNYADLSGATLFDAILSGENVDRASADLRSAKLNGAKLSGADLRQVNFNWACLPKANFSHLDEDYRAGNRKQTTLLRGANLTNAYLKDANFREVNITGVDLTNADLTGADLTGAWGWSEKQLAACESLKGATMPNGQKYEDWRKDR